MTEPDPAQSGASPSGPPPSDPSPGRPAGPRGTGTVIVMALVFVLVLSMAAVALFLVGGRVAGLSDVAPMGLGSLPFVWLAPFFVAGSALLPFGVVAIGLVLLFRRPNTRDASNGPVPVRSGDHGVAFPVEKVGVPHPLPHAHDGAPTGPQPLAAPTPPVRVRFRPAFPFVGLVTWSVVFLILGILGLLDAAGIMSVGPGALAAVVLMLFSGGLTYSAFRGRARGLVLPIAALAAALGLLAAFDVRLDSLDPTFDLAVSDQATLPSVLNATAGTSVLDLANLELTSDRSVSIRQTAGTVRVLLPTDARTAMRIGVGLGSVSVARPSRSATVWNQPDITRKWMDGGVPAAGSVVDGELLARQASNWFSLAPADTIVDESGFGKHAETAVGSGSGAQLTLDISMGVGTIEVIDPHWADDQWNPVKPEQLCTVGGAPHGIVKPCSEVEVARRVALCINDNQYLVDCREDRPGTPDNPRIAACRDFSGDQVDCATMGLEPANAELISPQEAPSEGQSPVPTIAMPGDPVATTTTTTQPGGEYGD